MRPFGHVSSHVHVHVHVHVGREYQEQIRKFFLSSTGERGHFSCFSTFQSLDYKLSKNVKANSCGFILHNKKGPLNKCAKFHTWNQTAVAMI